MSTTNDLSLTVIKDHEPTITVTTKGEIEPQILLKLLRNRLLGSWSISGRVVKVSKIELTDGATNSGEHQ